MSDSLLMLLEMIEDVLEEQNIEDEVAVVAAKIKEKFPQLADNLQVGVDKNKIVVNNTGTRDVRAEIVKTLKADLKLKPSPKLYRGGALPSGTEVSLKQGSTAGSSKTKSKYASNRIAELFEGNLVAALNGSPGTMKDGGRDGWMADAPYPQRAEEIIKTIDGLELGQGAFEKLATEPKNVTPLYKFFGVTNPTPKTDITNGPLKISVKKKKGTILSAEVGESKALMAVAYGFKLDNSGQPTLDTKSETFQAILGVASGLSKEIWNSPELDTTGRRRLGNEALVKLFSANILEPQTLKFNILLEAITGNNRFITDDAKANQILEWQWEPQSKGTLTEIETWATENNNNLKLDVRWRGEGRSGGFRIESLSKPFKKRMLTLLAANTPYPVNEQEATQVSPTMDRRIPSSMPSEAPAPPPPFEETELAVRFAFLFRDILFSEIKNKEKGFDMSFEGEIGIFSPDELVDTDG